MARLVFIPFMFLSGVQLTELARADLVLSVSGASTSTALFADVPYESSPQILSKSTTSAAWTSTSLNTATTPGTGFSNGRFLDVQTAANGDVYALFDGTNNAIADSIWRATPGGSFTPIASLPGPTPQTPFVLNQASLSVRGSTVAISGASTSTSGDVTYQSAPTILTLNTAGGTWTSNTLDTFSHPVLSEGRFLDVDVAENGEVYALFDGTNNAFADSIWKVNPGGSFSLVTTLPGPVPETPFALSQASLAVYGDTVAVSGASTSTSLFADVPYESSPTVLTFDISGGTWTSNTLDTLSHPVLSEGRFLDVDVAENGEMYALFDGTNNAVADSIWKVNPGGSFSFVTTLPGPLPDTPFVLSQASLSVAVVPEANQVLAWSCLGLGVVGTTVFRRRRLSRF